MGKQIIDLTGRTFGILRVLESAEPRKDSGGHLRRYWLCECECGNQKEISQHSLMHTDVKSCGCLQKKSVQERAIDLSGQHIGMLQVLELAEPYIYPDGKSSRRWLCRCDCGNEVIRFQTELRNDNGIIKNCGCLRYKQLREKLSVDMTGQTFDRLRVLGPVDLEEPCSNGSKLAWKCQCECGNIVIKTRKDLMSGKLHSCGCLLSETAKKKREVDNVFGYLDGTMVSALNSERKANKNSKSGVKGVYWNDREQRWIAKITFQRKSITLGRFKNIDDAIAARKEAEEKYFDPVIEKYNSLKSED